MPESDSVFSLVENEITEGRFTSALMKLTDISNNYNYDETYLRLLAKTLKALGDETALIKVYEVLAKKTNANTDSIEYMTELYTQGRLNEALDVALLLQESNLNESQRTVVYRLLIKLYTEFNDFEGVEEIFNLYPGSAEDDLMLWGLGAVRISEKKTDEAMVLLKACVLINPANDRAWISLALLHEELGDRELALANLERAFDANPSNSMAIKLLIQWRRSDPVNTAQAMNRVQYYLSKHEFDEDVSLCYMQMLKDINDMASLKFETNKLAFYNPAHFNLFNLKKNTEAGMKTP